MQHQKGYLESRLGSQSGSSWPKAETEPTGSEMYRQLSHCQKILGKYSGM